MNKQTIGTTVALLIYGAFMFGTGAYAGYYKGQRDTYKLCTSIMDLTNEVLNRTLKCLHGEDEVEKEEP